MMVPLPQKIRVVLVLLSVGSISKRFLTSSASQKLKKWVSASHMTAWTDITLSKPRMGRFNSTRMKWAYHTLTSKNPRTWPSYKQYGIILKVSPRKKSPRPNLIVKPR